MHSNRKAKLVATLILATLLSPNVLANQNTKETDVFVPVISVSSASASVAVSSLIGTFQLLNDFPISGEIFDEEFHKVNFFFASGNGYIVDKKISASSVDFFKGEFKEILTSLDTGADDCYVQRFKFLDRKTIVVAIHNEDMDFRDDVLKCLVAGMWHFKFGNLDKYNPEKWKSEFVNLTSEE